MNTDSGIVGARCETDTCPPFAYNIPSSAKRVVLPIHGELSVNARLYPITTHSTVMRHAIAKLCAIVDSRFFLRTMPP